MTLRIPLAVIALPALAACDNSSAVQTRDRTAAVAGTAIRASETVETTTTREVEPGLTVSRTVDAKIARLYARNGADFGAVSAEDYLAKVTAFTTRPPRDAERVKRPNGDTLIY